MLKLIIGLKGTGKTKTLIQMINHSLDTTKGSVVCIEKGKVLTYDVKYQCRLIDAEEFSINDESSLFGFVAGILASNHDVTDLYVDAAYRICGENEKAFDSFVEKLASLVDRLNINCAISASIDPEKATDTVKKYVS